MVIVYSIKKSRSKENCTNTWMLRCKKMQHITHQWISYPQSFMYQKAGRIHNLINITLEMCKANTLEFF